MTAPFAEQFQTDEPAVSSMTVELVLDTMPRCSDEEVGTLLHVCQHTHTDTEGEASSAEESLSSMRWCHRQLLETNLEGSFKACVCGQSLLDLSRIDLAISLDAQQTSMEGH